MSMLVRRLAVCAAMAAALSACQTMREQESSVKPEIAVSYLADKPEELKKHFYVSLAQGKRNQVLNDMRLGLASMELGRTDLAENLLDDALNQIEAVYADSEQAAKARELFAKETIKDFKGEPYERSMAYYYRGLLYLKAGDYDNARASFLAGFNQDSLSESEKFQADFALMKYLQGWASRCRGNSTTAAEDFKEFQSIRENFPLPAADDNVLILVETGTAPAKQSTGEYKQFLNILRSSVMEIPRITLPGIPAAAPAAPAVPAKGKAAAPAAAPAPVPPTTLTMKELEDIYFQASTRGGRAFDAILAGKAEFKQGANMVGDVALMAAASTASYGNNRDAAGAAAALLVIGLLAKASAAAANPEADIRYWDNLPDRVYALSARLPSSVTSLPVDFLSSDGELIKSREITITRAGSCGLGWVRSEPANQIHTRAPFSAPAEAMAQPVILPVIKPTDAPSSASPSGDAQSTATPVAPTVAKQ